MPERDVEDALAAAERALNIANAKIVQLTAEVEALRAQQAYRRQYVLRLLDITLDGGDGSE